MTLTKIYKSKEHQIYIFLVPGFSDIRVKRRKGQEDKYAVGSKWIKVAINTLKKF